MVDQVRRRTQQATLGHRGHQRDPLYRIRKLLLTAAEQLTEHGRMRLRAGLAVGNPTGEVVVAWQGKELQRSDRGPFVTLRPHKPAAPQEPPVPANAPSKSSFTVRRYFTQALYPRVICYDPGDLVAGLAMSFDPQPFPGRDQPPTDVAALARQERCYKLSALESTPLRNPLWCSVKYGPWLAVAEETESCLEGMPNKWKFFIVEVPEVALIWFGEWTDMPAVPSLTVVMGDLVLAGYERFCCPGFQWCPTTQSCIPLQVDCQDALKA